ncbi:nucleotidyltransferase domain-containing protein [Candidatus Woesearchaeota archaeon]|nr:nucleotidyltransferase domain-containing protein [Candidatus Woesearchaeota archaeon]
MVKIHTQDKLLSLLLSNKREHFSIREISKRIKIDYKTVYLLVQNLIQNKIILSQKAGQTTLCSINLRSFNSDIFRAESLRKEELLKNNNFSALQSYFKEVKNPFFVLLLFGSYASGKARTGSDIDLMLITDDKTIESQIKNQMSLIPLPVHLLSFTAGEFISMLKTTEFNVGQEAFYNNIILFGIEDYYRLIQGV